MKLITLNVCGLRDDNKRLTFLQWLSHLSCDIVCLQETHVLSPFEANSCFFSFGFLSLVSPGSNRSCGTVILYRATFILNNHCFDTEGRFSLAEFSFRDAVFRVASLYAPNLKPQRDDFLMSCISVIDPSVPTFVCGDFNAVFDRSRDRRGSSPFVSGRESCSTLLDFFLRMLHC